MVHVDDGIYGIVVDWKDTFANVGHWRGVLLGRQSGKGDKIKLSLEDALNMYDDDEDEE